MAEGQRPVGVGCWFALGHSTIVVLVAGLLAIAASAYEPAFNSIRDAGNVIGVSVSAGFLILIGLINLVVLTGVWRAWRAFRKTGVYDAERADAFLAKGGLLARILRPLFGRISKSWHMYPLGFLFALGFDTATEISLFGVTAAAGSEGVPFWAIMAFPALFTAGMALADTADGVLMLGAYGWAYVNPERKFVYNLAITGMSVVVAFVIGGIEALGLIGEKLKLGGWFWDAVASLNESMSVFGLAIVAIFAVAALLSMLAYKMSALEAPRAGSV